MDKQEKTLLVVREKGPLLPADVGKELGTNLIFAGAILSELVARGQIKVSHLKFGGSPLYFAPGQEPRLQRYSERLNDKERAAYERLKEEKVLRDTRLEPVVRVALRNLKDFAIPREHSIGGEEEIFWTWYLLDEAYAHELISGRFLPKPSPDPQEPRPDQETEMQITVEPEQSPEAEPSVTSVQEQLEQEPQTLTAPPAVTKTPQPSDTKEQKFRRILNFLADNEIKIIRQEMRGAEADFILEVPSAVGALRYYCKAKTKKNNNHGDVSAAFVQGQIKKLPVLYLTTGKVTRKAKELLDTELRSVTVIEI